MKQLFILHNTRCGPFLKSFNNTRNWWITDLFAEIFLDFASFHGGRTAVSTIVIAGFTVVFVIAVTVSLVLRYSASVLTKVIRINALALEIPSHSILHD